MTEPEFDDVFNTLKGTDTLNTLQQFATVNKTLTARYPEVFSPSFHGISVEAGWIPSVDAALGFLSRYVRYTGETILVRGVTTRDPTRPPVFEIAWPMNQPQAVLIKVLECVMINTLD